MEAMYRTSSALLIVIALCRSASASPLTLEEAIRRAVAANPTLRSAGLDRQIARSSEVQADATYDPFIEATLALDAEHTQPAAAALSAPAPLGGNDIGGTVALRKRYLPGTEVRVAAGARRQIQRTRIPLEDSSITTSQRTIAPSLEASITQPLLGGRRAGGAVRGRLAAELDATRSEQLALANDLVRDVEQAYWLLYLAEQEVRIRHDATVAAQTQLRLAEAEIARGARPALDAAEIEEELARRREDELLAGSEITARSAALERLIGVAPTGKSRATDRPEEAPAAENESATSPRLRALSRRTEAASKMLEQARDEARWRLDASIAGSLSAPRERYPDAFDATAGLSGWTIGVTLSLRAPLSDRGPRAAIDIAAARLAQARLAEEDGSTSIAADLVRLEDARSVAGQRRRALSRAVSLAEQNLVAEQNRWARGDSTAFEILRRQAAVSEMRLRAERARIDEILADRAQAAASGALLAKHHVTPE